MTDTDKKDGDIIEWEKEFDLYFPISIEYVLFHSPNDTGTMLEIENDARTKRAQLKHAETKRVITDLLTRQAEKSYKQGFSDAYKQLT